MMEELQRETSLIIERLDTEKKTWLDLEKRRRLDFERKTRRKESILEI